MPADATVDDVVVPVAPEKGAAVYVAPAWQMTWWRFRKHKLAVVCLWVFVVIGLIAIAPEFFATQDPNATAARNAYIPPQTLRIVHEGRLVWPFAYGVEGQRDARTLRMEWVKDQEVRYPLRFFVQGFSYKLSLQTRDGGTILAEPTFASGWNNSRQLQALLPAREPISATGFHLPAAPTVQSVTVWAIHDTR